MPEGYVNVLFSKGLVLDDIIQLLNIEKINLQEQIIIEFLSVIANQEPLKSIKPTPLYVLKDINGKEYYI